MQMCDSVEMTDNQFQQNISVKFTDYFLNLFLTENIIQRAFGLIKILIMSNEVKIHNKNNNTKHNSKKEAEIVVRNILL